jgi:hypothetical protein
LNKIDNESAVAAAREEKEKKAAVLSLLKTLEDTLHNRIMQKKQEMHRTQNRAYTDREYGQR